MLDIPLSNISSFNGILRCDQSATQKDAIFLSPHKFVGGVDTPGILVAKKHLFRNTAPSDGGGGSVFFVSFPCFLLL